jgi:prepilin-type N-terminal cleavage/methylation domain-containing protein
MKIQKEKGFTIIEVVLVLAIAGLIFLMVFIALPALQRSQRDTQRKNDVSRAVTAITNYTSNNRGALPTLNAAFVSSYLAVSGDTFSDPSGSTYVFTSSSTATLSGTFTASGSGANQGVIYYSVGSTCGSTSDTIVDAGARKVALRIYLEGGGFFCQNN